MCLGNNYWALWSTLRCPYECLYVPKSECQLGPTGKSFCFFHKTEWVSMILNSKSWRTSKLHDWLKSYNNFGAFFFKQIKNFKCRHLGCLSRGNRLEYCAAHSDFVLDDCIWSLFPKQHFQSLKTYKVSPISLSVFWDQTSDMLAKIKIWVCSAEFQSMSMFEVFWIFEEKKLVKLL